MKFDVRITFDGLYLLAVDRSNNLVHAILMNMGEDTPCGDASHQMTASMSMPMSAVADQPKHFPMLYFDAAHTALEPADRTEMTGHLYGVSLKNRVVSLDGPTPIDLNFDPKIVDIGQISSAQKLDPKHCGKSPVRGVAGRITLKSGRALPVTRSTLYDIIPPNGRMPSGQIEIATRVEWLISDLEDTIGRFKIELRGIDDDALQKPHVLLPVDVTRIIDGRPQTRPEIQLHVYCAPAHALPGGDVIPTAVAGDAVPHLVGFFQLFPGVDAPTLKINKPERTGSTETCIGLRATVS